MPQPPALPDWTADPARQRAMVLAALAQARAGERRGEVPVGAVLYGPEGKVLARAYNAPITLKDPTAHAEILCLRRAARKLGNYRLTGCVLAVTLEPCMMCVGALVHARVAGIVFGAADPKAGALISRLECSGLPFLNHTPGIIGPVLPEACGGLLAAFFRARRGKAGASSSNAPEQLDGD